jgi:hypothetical protein
VSVDPRSSSFYKNETQGSYLITFFDNIPISTSIEPLAALTNIPLRELQQQDGTDGTGDIDVSDYQGTEHALLDPFTNSEITQFLSQTMDANLIMVYGFLQSITGIIIHTRWDCTINYKKGRATENFSST